MSEMPVTPMPEQPKKNNTTLIIVVVVLLVLCCCCVVIPGLYWLWNNGDSLLGNAMNLATTLA